MVFRLLAAVGAVAALASCYSPPVTASCEVRCAPDNACPEGLECNLTDRFCHLPGDADACPPPDGAALGTLAAGGGFTCGIDPDHGLWCWGSNAFGQIGAASAELQEPLPRFVTAAGVTGWSDLAAGGAHACAIAEPTGALYCWGLDADGQLGDGSPGDGTTSAPGEIAEPGPWDEVVAGEHHTCARKSGELWCWGANYAGTVGNGDLDNTVHTPTRVLTTDDWIAVDASRSHTCGIRDEAGTRRLYCWGDDAALGITPTPIDPVPVPTEVPHPVGDRTWARITTGAYFTCAIDSTSALWCWGYDDYWEMGDETGQIEPQPALVDEQQTWTAVSAGTNHLCAIAGTALACWGRGQAGQIGARIERAGRGGPLAGAWTSVDAGRAHTCATSEEGDASCWGDNGDGELGTGEAGDAYAPVLVDDTRAWTAVSAGDTATCGIVDGDLECWGLDIEEIFGNPGDRMRPQLIAYPELAPLDWAEIQVGSLHACAITTSQALWCWGRGDDGQLGNSFEGTSNAPVLSLGAWSDVAVGNLYTCGLTGGDLWCWGYNENGRTGELATDGTVVLGHMVGSGYADVSTGNMHACAVMTSGAGVCWGLNQCHVVASTGLGDPTIPTSQQGSGWLTIETSWDDTLPHNTGIGPAGLASSWGCADSGRLGNGDPNTDQMAPDALALGNWSAVSVGGPIGCGIRGVGELWCWGDGSFGVRGDASDGDTADPVRILPSMSGWQHVSVGLRHICAIDMQSSLWCWGDNSAMQVGQGLGMTPVPQAVMLPD